MRAAYFPFLLVTALLSFFRVSAADDTACISSRLRHHIDRLAGPAMRGRGYVQHGRQRAAGYVAKTFKGLGLSPVGEAHSYRQSYFFSVNAFPGAVQLGLDGHDLTPGIDYLVDAGSASFKGKELAVRSLDISGLSAAALATVLAQPGRCVWLLRGTDSFCAHNAVSVRALPAALPAGCYIIPQMAKLMWTVAREQHEATVFYVREEALHEPSFARVRVSARLRENAESENIIACVPGRVADSFIVFSAHYDHLGMMGKRTVFPGASDNASGTAMLLYLAEYYAKHPQRYTVVFIAFSGEEAGLMGSAWYVAHPLFPLNRIKFLTNVDIMGDATDGITVVNATEYPSQFSALNAVNDLHHYLPAIKSRGKAANSDHYHFAQAGVPAFFLYTNGGKGYYHDVFDKPEAVTFYRVPAIALLLQDFVTRMLPE